MSVDLDRLESIFTEALASAAPAERAAFLDRACAGDAELRRRVEALLAAHDADDRVPDLPHFTSPPIEESPGMKIGRYKLIEQIGEGGFGVVFRAEQESPVRRTVALKIIKLGMDTRQVVARFEQERQALAIMDHPGVAKVFDAGATESGRPFFVMELVAGVPLIQHCDQKQLGIRDRLELFAQACQAVQHAHQKGLIHRDIKPSNVLVSMQDGRAVAKVIDFGIAKATQARLTERTLFTEHQQLVGTPEYMSPEQAAGDDDVDTRSDIYSLGVLLYELLTGLPPFEPRDLRSKALAEMQRIIREVDPPTPSTRLSGSASLASVAARRGVEPKKLRATIHGELDWIVMKCLEKDRTRRYDSAAALANDVTSFLVDEPIVAGAPSRIYRLRKLIRRNRGPVIASAAVLVVLVGGIVGTTIGLIGQSRLRIEAQQQAAEAKRQSAMSTAISQFQADMLASADPSHLLGDKVTVLQAVTATVKELDAGKLKDQPLVEASLREIIGSTLSALARYDAAEPNLRKALELRRVNQPPDHRDIAVSLTFLGLLLRDQGKPAEAAPFLREALDIRRKIAPGGSRDVAQSLNNVAVVMFDQGNAAAAEQCAREALEINRKILPASDVEIANSLNNVAVILLNQGKFSAADPFIREALDIFRRTLPPNHPSIASALDNLGKVLYTLRRFDEAEPLFREALDARRKALPAGHPQIAVTLNSLAALHLSRGDAAGGEVFSREALEIVRAALPAGHPDIAANLNMLARLLRRQGKFAEAESAAREALAIQRKSLPPGAQDIAVSLTNLGSSLQAQGRPTEAEPFFAEGEAIVSHAPNPNSVLRNQCIQGLIDAYTALNQSNPGQGFDAKAQAWRAKLPATAPTTH